MEIIIKLIFTTYIHTNIFAHIALTSTTIRLGSDRDALWLRRAETSVEAYAQVLRLRPYLTQAIYNIIMFCACICTKSMHIFREIAMGTHKTTYRSYYALHSISLAVASEPQRLNQLYNQFDLTRPFHTCAAMISLNAVANGISIISSSSSTQR